MSRIEIQVVTNETPEAEIGIMYPDVEIVRAQEGGHSLAAHGGANVREDTPTAMMPVTVSVPLLEFEVRLATVEIRDVAHNQLVTSIENLSPVNKREPELSKYREKRQRLRAAGVHGLEIGLLRRGQRLLLHPRVPASDYRVSLMRVASQCADIWSINLQDRLPVVPMPLRAPDADLLLDLGEALSTIYDRAAYDLSIDYNASPPSPSLSAEEQDWLECQLRQYR
jgi:hypothetical protein